MPTRNGVALPEPGDPPYVFSSREVAAWNDWPNTGRMIESRLKQNEFHEYQGKFIEPGEYQAKQFISWVPESLGDGMQARRLRLPSCSIQRRLLPGAEHFEHLLGRGRRFQALLDILAFVQQGGDYRL